MQEKNMDRFFILTYEIYPIQCGGKYLIYFLFMYLSGGFSIHFCFFTLKARPFSLAKRLKNVLKNLS